MQVLANFIWLIRVKVRSVFIPATGRFKPTGDGSQRSGRKGFAHVPGRAEDGGPREKYEG